MNVVEMASMSETGIVTNCLEEEKTAMIEEVPCWIMMTFNVDSTTLVKPVKLRTVYVWQNFILLYLTPTVLTFAVYSFESLTTRADESSIGLSTDAGISTRIWVTMIFLCNVKKSITLVLTNQIRLIYVTDQLDSFLATQKHWKVKCKLVC